MEFRFKPDSYGLQYHRAVVSQLAPRFSGQSEEWVTSLFYLSFDESQ